MKNNDIEKMLNSVNFQPDPSLKDKVLDKIATEPERTSCIESNKKPRKMRRLAVALSLCLFLIICGGSLCYVGLYNEEYMQVYVDINPSVELTVNRFNIVNKVVYLNNDASATFNEKEILGKSTDSALSEIMTELDKREYFKDNSQLYISVFSKKASVDKSVEKYYKVCEKYKNEKNLTVNINREKISKKDIINGSENKISPVKNKFIDEIISMGEELGENIKKEDLKNSSMEDLKNKIKELKEKRKDKLPNKKR